MAVELSDKELAELRASKEEADRLRTEHAAEKTARAKAEADHQAAVKKYDDDMKQVASYLQQQNQPPPEKEDEDPDAVVSRRDLKKAQDESARRNAESQAQQAQGLLKNQREINKQLAVQRLGPKAAKYMAEIDQHLNKLDPQVAAQPTAYDEVYKYVRAAHFEEELEEAKREGASDESETEHTRESESSTPAPSRPIPRSDRSDSTSPSSSVTATRAINRSLAAKPRLTDEQRRVAAGFGMSDDDYAGKWATDEVMVDNDFMGFGGRKRV